MQEKVVKITKRSTFSKGKKFFKQWQLIAMVIPGVLLVLIFNYGPMYGALIAFQNYSPYKGILGSDWVGFKYFKMFLGNPMIWRLMKNTLLLGVVSLIFSFPAPIVLALLMDQIRSIKFKKVVQTISYLPYFISTIVVVALLKEVVSIYLLARPTQLYQTAIRKKAKYRTRSRWKILIQL